MSERITSAEALRYAQGMAATEHARGRSDEERAWLDMCALLERLATPSPGAFPSGFEDWNSAEDAVYDAPPTSPATVEAVAQFIHAQECPDDRCDGGDLGHYEWLAQALADAGMLRGVVTEAMVERACAAAWSAEHPSVSWDEIRHTSPTAGEQVRAAIRAALSAAFDGEVSE